MKSLQWLVGLTILWNLSSLVLFLRAKSSQDSKTTSGENRKRSELSSNRDQFPRDFLNVPESYFIETIVKKPVKRGSGCFEAPPALGDLKFSNVLWQTLSTNKGTYYFLGAYLDTRELLPSGWMVRVLAMVESYPPPALICVLWDEKGKGHRSLAAAHLEILWRRSWGGPKNGTLQPFLVSCPYPSGSSGAMVMKSVSLVHGAESCRQAVTNNVRIEHAYRAAMVRNESDIADELSRKKGFAVCVKGMDFPDRSDLALKLVEWVNLLKILGADKIFVYEFQVHPDVSKVLRYFSDRGTMVVHPLTLPGASPNAPGLRNVFLRSSLHTKRLHEVLPYNDCLYRNLYGYRYMVLLDVDEVIMPLTSKTWAGLLNQVGSLAQSMRASLPASYNVRNVYFFDDIDSKGRLPEWSSGVLDAIPVSLHMSRHVVRSATFTPRGRYVKCFHDVARVKALHNHYPLACLVPPCSTFDVSPLMAELQHYRRDCHDLRPKTCDAVFRNVTVVDTSIWRYRETLVPTTLRDMENLRLLP